jgi:hypothetical protein
MAMLLPKASLPHRARICLSWALLRAAEQRYQQTVDIITRSEEVR